MGLLVASSITVTAPASVDGRGEVAVLNDIASGNFVGYLWDRSGFGGAAVRISIDPVVEGPGGVFNPFQDAHRSFTLEVELKRSTTYALSDARYNKLCRAFDAKSDDGSIVWPDTDGYTKQILFRREQPPSDPKEDGHVLLAGVCKDPRIYNNTPQTGSSPKTNNGNTGSPPTFTLTPTGSNVVITNTTAGYGSPAVTLTVGGAGVATGSAVTVDFNAKTVRQGGVNKDNAAVFPTSTWWEVIPGANTWSVTNASSVSISFKDAWSSA